MLLTFLCKSFVLHKQLRVCHARLERYTVSLLTISRISIVSWLCQFTRTVSYLHWNGNGYHRYGNTSNKYLPKLWCSTIWVCGTIKIIFRNKVKTLRIVPQCGTIQVNTVRNSKILIDIIIAVYCNHSSGYFIQSFAWLTGLCIPETTT